eukprot:g5251.t1
MTEGERADGWHQSSSKCFKVFDYKDNITSTPGITRAYRYPLAVAAMDGLGKLSTTGTNTMREYDVRGKSVSIEMWIRPDNYSNAEGVLFETGDGIHTECTCAILGGSLDSFDASTCKDDESDLYTPWSLYQIGETNDAGRAGKMICNAGLGVLLGDGHVVAKLNPLFGNFFNVTAKLPKQKSDVDFVHVVVAVKMSVPWEYCKKKDWCGSHRFHRDIRLTIYLNGRVLASSVCYGCGAWTSLDAVGVGGSATGGFGFKYGPIENRSKDLHSFTGNDNGDREMIDQRTKSEKDGDPVSRRRSAWECKECSDPLKIVMNTNNINGDWLSSGTVFTGYIALIRIYKKALSVADAEQNYGAYTIAGGITLPYPPSCTGPEREPGNEHSIIMDGLKIANPGYAPYSCPRQDALYGSDDLLGHSKCQSCPDGYYCPKEGTIYPIQCPLGSYQAGLNAKGCEMCPTGTWSNKKKLANDTITDRYGKPPDNYHYRQFRWSKCVEDVTDKNDPMLKRIFQGLTDMQTLGHPWFDETVGQHVRDLYTYFKADYSHKTSLFFRQMPQAMIDYVTGECKRFQMQTAYEKWLGNNPAEKDGFPIYKKIIQPKDTTGFALPPRTLNERLYAPEPQDANKLDDDTETRGEFIAFEQLWMMNKPEKVVYNNGKQKTRKVTTNPADCRRFWANQFQDPELIPRGSKWGFTIGNNLANTEIVLNVSGLSKYDMDTQLYIPKPLQLSLGKICDPYDEIEIAAKMRGAIEALFANFAEIGVEDVRDTFELSLVVQKQCTCKVPPDQTAIKGECGSRQCLEWDNCVGEEEFPDASYSRKAEIRNEMPLYRPLPSTAMYYITLVLGPYGIKCKKQNLKSCHEIEYGLTVNGDGNLQNRLNLDSAFLTFHALEDSTIVPLCASLDEDTFRKTWMRPTSLDETGSWDEFEGIDTSKCVLLRYRMSSFCLRPGCVGTELSNRARDQLLLCSTRHTMKVRDLQPGGSGRYFCASETCEARDQSGVTLPYEISEFECRMNWEDYICPTGTMSAQSSLSPVDCLIDWSQGLALSVVDPADFPYIYVPAMSHTTIEYNLLHMPLEMQPNVGFQFLFYTKELTRQRKIPSAALNPSSFEIKEAGAHQNMGLLHFTYTSTNATYIQVGAAILTGRFDRYYYHSLFTRTAKIYIDTPRRIRDAQPGIMADELEANWQFFAVLNRIDTDQADIKSILPMNLPLMMENGGTFSFLPQNNTEFCTSRFKNASRVNDSTRPGKADFCEGDYFGHYSIPVTNEFGTIFPSGVMYWRNGLQCEICHYDPGGVIEEGFWGEGGGLENCGKQFINFENPFAEEDGITFNKTRPYRVSHLQISDASRQMDLLFEPFQTFSTSSYLPYFSNCYRHGLKMSIFRLMEDPETCTFVKDRMLTAINPSDFFPMSLFQGHEGDKCDANITCIYDEFTTSVPGGIPEGSVFWFQKRERPLFYLTKRAQNISSMLRTLSSGTKGEDDWVPAREDVASELYAKRELVPVYVDIHDSTGSVQGDLQYMPRDVKFTIKYYTQVLPLGGTEKVIMLGKLSVGRYEKLTVEEECFSDCQYKRRRYFLHFTMEEMGLIEMINEYGLSTSAYLFLSAVIAGIIPVLVFLVWSNMRRKDKRNGNSNSTPNTAVMILAGMMNKKRAEFRKAKRVVANALRGSRKQFRQKESKKSEGELAESSEDLYDDITDAQIEKYFSNRLGISYEHNTFRSLQSRLNIHSAASKRLRTLRSNVSGPWAVYRKRFVAPAMSGFAMLVAFFGVGIGWAFLLYHKSMMGGAFTDLVPTNPALIRNIYELTLPRCIDRRARGEQIDAGNNCLTEYFINFNRGIRVATLLWMVGVMGIVISSNMLVYKPPRPQRQKRKVGEKIKKDVEFDASSEMLKIQTWKWFHYCNFAFVSQFVCLALIDSTSVPSFKKDPRIFWIILACVKSCRVIFDWLMKNVAEDELQASGLRVTCGVTEFLVTVTAAPNFISFVMATQLLLVLEILIIWKDSLLAETIEQLLSGTGIDRFELIGAGQTKTERRSYDVNLPNSVQQTKALKIVQNISILFASFLSYCMVLLLLLLFEDEYNRFNIKWQHVAVTLANVPFLPIVGFYLVDIEEMHGKHGMYIIMDWWAGVARGDVKRRFLWISEITRDISPALLEEKYDPKRKEPNILTLERSSCVFVPMCQKPNLELEEKYRELEKLGFTMRFFMGLFFQGFSTLLMTINMSGNMISWPTIDMVGMGMAVLSISFMKNIIRIGGPIVFKSLNLFISHKKYVEKKKSKFATSEKDKEALRRKTVADLCERLYMYRDEGKPDSQLVKVMTARVRDLVGDQIQKEDEIAKIIEDVAAEKAAKRSKRKKSRQKGNKLQIADVVPGVWPNELTHHKMV